MQKNVWTVRENRVVCERNDMLYGHFIEHFHRQIYGGIYDPESRFADDDGFREDVLDAMRRIKVPILRWPGGCFVSSYHWKNAVGTERVPMFDKSWRVEDPNSFGTDEFIRLCRKIGCKPYICTNAGTGTPEEMSDWVEYCNLENEGRYAKSRVKNGFPLPHNVMYWSIGNENYGSWELGAKSVNEWGRLVRESAKLMKHVDPKICLSAAALADIDWNIGLLKECGNYLDLISIHKYWNLMPEQNDLATYDETMAYTADLDAEIRKVRGLLTAMGLEKQIKIAYDEWNLRGWHHPNVHTIRQGATEDEYLKPRMKNDLNDSYTMADAVFTACFLNTLNRNGDIVDMANFAPIVNTRGCIFTHKDGIVLRSTYHVFELYTNYLGDKILDCFAENAEMTVFKGKNGADEQAQTIDVLCTLKDGRTVLAAVNKHPNEERELIINFEYGMQSPKKRGFRVITVNGDSKDGYNDIDKTQVRLKEGEWQQSDSGLLKIILEPHSVNAIEVR